MNSLNHGRFQEQIKFLRRQFLQDGDLPFTKVLTIASIAKIVQLAGLTWRERIFTPIVTLWVFLGQILSADNCCRAAVARLNAHRVSLGFLSGLAAFICGLLSLAIRDAAKAIVNSKDS